MNFLLFVFAGNTATDEVIRLPNTRQRILDQAESSLWGIALAEPFLQRLMLNSLETLFQAHHWRQLSPIRNSAKVALNAGGDQIIEEAINHNVGAAINMIREKSSIIANLENEGKISLSGAKYDLASGSVQFF